ncbi:hypothetical protein IscW_ISCW016973 [Ixodes scapularis]|uniref:CUB domain-containing protein n=1 Tax=Ixodes scapularis TaxID=6945 RepID=B7PBP6_IXOSC|nr:hypothetical protein IscW_ISCW016973 [Ixodes scapularis]|eukprot:XP_002408678.1 hypothetical protein IscW_ISCW016973 [Ixodes scapularis]
MTRVHSAVCVWWLRSSLNFAAVSLLLGLCWPLENERNTTCGGFLTQFRGSFQSPNYPDHYDDLSECRWYIFAPREFAILIEKHSIDIEDDAARADCPYDHLKTFTASQGLMEIPEDKSKRTAVILRRRWCFRSSRGNTYQFTFDYFDTVGDPPKCKHMYLKVLEKNEGQMRSHPRLCGKVIPEPVHTRSSSVSLLFLSDRALDKNGLHVRWKVFGCNEDRSEPSGQLRFPRDGVFIAYPATCVWTLIASQDQTVELSVRKLNLERCDVEYLRVFEGQEEGRALLDDLCQLDSSVVITSTRRVMSLHLRMQSLREEAVEASYQLKAVPCGGLYEASEGSLVSPRDLANVDGGVTCIWIIRVKTGYLPRIEFLDFSFTESQNCSAAYLEMMVIANRTGGVAQSNSFPNLYVHESECSWNVYAPKVCEMMVIANRTGGVAQSNSFPNLYVHESECSWNVYAPKGERLALFLTELRFSKTKYCAVSTLTVMAILTKPESRAFLSSEDSLSLRICGGVMKFAYMSVPGADCTSTKLEAPAEIARNIDPKEQSDSAIVWEEIDQIPN